MSAKAVAKLAAKAARKAADRNPLYNPMAALSGHTLKNAATQMTNAQLNPALNAYDRERNQATLQGVGQQQRLKSYYDQYAPQASAAVFNSNMASKALALRLTALGQGTQRDIGLGEQNAQSAMGADAALRGQGLDGGANQRLTAEFGAEKANDAGARELAASRDLKQQNTFEGLASSAQATAGLRQQDAQSLLASNLTKSLADINGKKADLAATRGGVFAKNLTDLRDKQFENAAVSAATGVKQATLQETIARDKSNAYQKALDRKARAQAAGQKVNAYGYSTDQWAGFSPQKRQQIQLDYKAAAHKVSTNANQHGSSTGHDWQTQGQQKTFQKQLGQALSFASDYKKQGAGRHDVARTLLQGVKGYADKTNSKGQVVRAGKKTVPAFDQLAASVALDAAYDGHISQANIKRLHAYGIKVGPLGLKTARQYAKAHPKTSANSHPDTSRYGGGA